MRGVADAAMTASLSRRCRWACACERLQIPPRPPRIGLHVLCPQDLGRGTCLDPAEQPTGGLNASVLCRFGAQCLRRGCSACAGEQWARLSGAGAHHAIESDPRSAPRTQSVGDSHLKHGARGRVTNQAQAEGRRRGTSSSSLASHGVGCSLLAEHADAEERVQASAGSRAGLGVARRRGCSLHVCCGEASVVVVIVVANGVAVHNLPEGVSVAIKLVLVVVIIQPRFGENRPRGDGASRSRCLQRG